MKREKKELRLHSPKNPACVQPMGVIKKFLGKKIEIADWLQFKGILSCRPRYPLAKLGAKNGVHSKYFGCSELKIHKKGKRLLKNLMLIATIKKNIKYLYKRETQTKNWIQKRLPSGSLIRSMNLYALWTVALSSAAATTGGRPCRSSSSLSPCAYLFKTSCAVLCPFKVAMSSGVWDLLFLAFTSAPAADQPRITHTQIHTVSETYIKSLSLLSLLSLLLKGSWPSP